MPGGLGTELEPVHLLDERTLVVPVGGLGLSLLLGDAAHVDLLADLHLGHAGLGGAEVLLVELLPALLLLHVSLGDELFPVHVEDSVGDLCHSIGGHGGHEPAGDELVELPLVALELGGGGSSGGVDRRMVRGAPLSPGGGDLLLLEELLGLLLHVGVLQLLEDAPEAQALGVLGVLGTGIGDVSSGVEVLRDLHGGGGRDADLVGLDLHHGGVEGRGPVLLLESLLE